MILKILLRLLFISFTVAFVVNAYAVAVKEKVDYTVAVLIALITAIVASSLVLFEWRYQRKLAREMVAVFFGLAAGLCITVLLVLISLAFFLPSAVETLSTTGPLNLGEAFAYAFWQIQPWIPLLLVACCYIAISIVLQTRSDFRFLLPYIDFAQQSTQESGFLLDTSVLIDGRIVDLATRGIFSTPLILPDYVLRELQRLADSKDPTKRLRGRRGLDNVARLQQNEMTPVVVRETETSPESAVDVELLRTAKEIHARILTTDMNLQKLCRIEGVIAVNLHELAQALKPQVVPGDILSLKILRAGQEPGQGVGYLEDGTMVVVERGEGAIGTTIEVEITGSIQTSAGRLIFAKPVTSPEPLSSSPSLSR